MLTLTVLGLDPSLSNLGAFKARITVDPASMEVVELEPIKLSLTQTAKTKNKQVRVNSDDLERARLLHRGLHALLSDVDLAFVELPIGSQSARPMVSYGVSVSLIASLQIPVIQMLPAELKLAACGIKTATKQQMIDWAVTNLPDEEWLRTRQGNIHADNEHIADALAAIVAGVDSEQFKQILLAYK